MKLELKGWVIPASVGVVSFAAGFGVGYFISKHKKVDAKIEEVKEELRSENVQLEFKFEEVEQRFASAMQQADHVVKKLKDDGQAFLNKFNEPVIQAAKDNHPSNDKRGTKLASIRDVEEELLTTNVFQSDDEDEWDYEDELSQRSEEEPYIIHRDEYDENEEDYSTSTLTYYEGDNILCDEHDVPVYKPDKVVGKLIFGHGSRDPSICFIRNDNLQALYEVIVDHGFFQTEVLGQQIEHSNRRNHFIPKFRME